MPEHYCMLEWQKALVAILVVVLVRFIYYQSRLWEITRLRKRYWEFLGDLHASATWLAEQTTSYKRMISECSLASSPFPAVPGPGLAPVAAHPDDNLTFRSEVVADLNNSMMLRIQGHYRMERNRTFSPLYWVEFLVFLPREVLKHLGLSSEMPVVRVSDVAWWAMVVWEVVAWIIGKGSVLHLLRTLAK